VETTHDDIVYTCGDGDEETTNGSTHSVDRRHENPYVWWQKVNIHQTL